MTQTISSAIAWWAHVTPDTPAVRIQGDTLSYRDLHEWSGRVAARLIERGVAAGDRVGIAAANSTEFCALAFGIVRAGAIVLPLSVRLTSHEAGDILGDTRPVLLFADEENRAKLASVWPSVDALSEIATLRQGLPVGTGLDRDLDPEAAVVIITTSGSTAKPKGVVYSHRSMTGSACEFAVHLPGCTGPGLRTITLSPLSTSAGFVQLVTFTVLGCTMLIEPNFDAERVLRMVEDERINVFAAVPLFLERMAQCARFEKADLSSIRVATVGGAAVTHQLLETYKRKGVTIRQMYGLTEVGGFATIMPADAARDQPEKCGRGGIFTEIRVVDEQGRRCPSGQPGEIIVRGPGVMLGYWDNPTATAEALRNGWLHSGDIGTLDDEGFLTFVSRKKDIIISGGLNISAAEVERVVGDFEGIVEVAVIAASDDRFGETPMAIVYSGGQIEIALLIAHCNERLADYKVPRYVVVRQEPLPRLATGKLSKRHLRDEYKDAQQTLTKVR